MKNVHIDGTKNRYWIHKLKDPNENLKPKMKKKVDSFQESIVSKINGYKQQDILKKLLQDSEFIDYDFVYSLLHESQFKCFYCQTEVLMEYDIVREMKQWSLDRKDNSIGHIKTNVVLACLECNLKRKNKNMKSFLFTKQLTVKQENVINASDKDRDSEKDRDGEKDGDSEKDGDNNKMVICKYI